MKATPDSKFGPNCYGMMIIGTVSQISIQENATSPRRLGGTYGPIPWSHRCDQTCVIEAIHGPYRNTSADEGPGIDSPRNPRIGCCGEFEQTLRSTKWTESDLGQLRIRGNASISTKVVSMADRFEYFDRGAWAKLRDATPLTLTENDVEEIRGITEHLDLDEVETIYLALSRLINLHVVATRSLTTVTHTFLGTAPRPLPYVIGIGGSVAVGKSTTARLLQTLLASWPEHPRVALVTTDGFLYPNAELEKRSLMARKGFPESYDTAALLAFLQEVKSGSSPVRAPVYSHLSYDIVEGEEIIIDAPDILIVEGLNVLQGGNRSEPRVVSDYFDFSIYVDADPDAIKQWYIERFLALRDTVFVNPRSYFQHYSGLDRDEATAVASDLWDSINAPNLETNIAPTKPRANCILTKDHTHRVGTVALRQ